MNQNDSFPPTLDYLENRNLDDHGGLESLLREFIRDINRQYFVQWEAVIRDEQGLRLTRKQKKLLRSLLNFGDPDDDILYIDGLPRPKQSWHEIALHIVPRLLLDEVVTSDAHFAVVFEGWPELAAALNGPGKDLSCPKGCKNPIDVIPIELQHRLWLQWCFDALSGLGQDDELTLAREGQFYRVEFLIQCLKEHKESVQFLNLTLEKMLKMVVLPPEDEAILTSELYKELDLSSHHVPLADKL